MDAQRTRFRPICAAVVVGAFIVAMAANAAVGAPEPRPQTSVIRGRNGKHSFTVRLSTGPFQRKRHRIRESGTNVWIDGKPEWNRDGSKNWLGTDGGVPSEEFTAFCVEVDGRPWPVPRRLYGECYDPHIEVRYVRAQLAADGKRLTIGIAGSDGAGSYGVTWYLRSDGKHRRKVDLDEC